MKRLRVGIIYKITYPNGKIYIGQDRTDDCNYFGSADSFSIRKDFSSKELMDFTVRKEILKKIKGCTVQELNSAERFEIGAYRSTDPKVGYNRTRVARKRCTEVWE